MMAALVIVIGLHTATVNFVGFDSGITSQRMGVAILQTQIAAPPAPEPWRYCRFLDDRTPFAAAVPPRQPPPVALALCAETASTRASVLESVAPHAAAWLRHAQSQTRERRSQRRPVRTWEAAT